MRDRYLKQLKLVHDDLLRMGSRVEHALADAMLPSKCPSTGIGAIPRVDSVARALVVTRASRVGYVLVGARGFEPPASCSRRNSSALSNKDLRSFVAAGGGTRGRRRRT